MEVPSTRSQWPRAGHSGFKHCTVQPGRYCISFASLVLYPGGGRGTTAPPKLPGTKQKRVKLAGLCAEVVSESREIYTISSVGVAGRLKSARGGGERVRRRGGLWP